MADWLLLGGGGPLWVMLVPESFSRLAYPWLDLDIGLASPLRWPSSGLTSCLAIERCLDTLLQYSLTPRPPDEAQVHCPSKAGLSTE